MTCHCKNIADQYIYLFTFKLKNTKVFPKIDDSRQKSVMFLQGVLGKSKINSAKKVTSSGD